MLLTGTNASGKSTFIKALALSAIMAQSLCTTLCTAYQAASFTIYSSMVLRDSVVDGDSYFIAEIKSLKRIFDAVKRGERVLSTIDEVLRGTNTVERIAASSVLLSQLAGQGALCVAATHDGELCGILDGAYRMMHFSEHVTEDNVAFDYLLKEGKATTCNAIELMDRLGFDEAVIKDARDRAARFQLEGSWTVRET